VTHLNYSGKFDAKLPIDGTGAHSNTHLHVESVSSAHAPADAILVSDADLLFHGDFKRSGVDLILSKDNHELVLQDYFRGEKRAALSSPDGAHLTGDIINALTGHQQFAQAGGSANAAQVIGHVTKLSGTATAIRNGVSIILNNGDNVEKGDVVQSGSGSTLGITFIDGTVFGLSSNARMVLNEMVYDPNGSNNSSLLSLVAGTISFVAGETAKHGDMKIDTPVATMGIRGTAVLVEIDFDIPQGGLPNAKFQVLVEPDGTTGRYVLFDKVTLAPIATVDQAGVVKSLSQGILTSYSAPLSAEIQKLITDVFSLKFTDNTNTNTKTAQLSTDTLLPQAFAGLKLPDGSTAIPIIINVNPLGSGTPPSPGGSPTDSNPHIPGPPAVVVTNSFIDLTHKTDSSALDIASNIIRFADLNAGDRPTVSTKFGSFTYLNAQGQDITATLTAQQLAAIAAVEAKLVLVPDPGNNNNGVVTWTYSVADSAFDFLAPGDTLVLTYIAQVDNNFAANNETSTQSFKITIGSNHPPIVEVTSVAIAELIGTGNTTPDIGAGTIKFTDLDSNDRPVASTAFTSFTYTDASHNALTLTAQQQAAVAAVKVALSVAQTPGNTNNGTATWTYSVADSKLDFLAAGEILTLTYAATVDDGRGGVTTKPFTVTITGTNDAPVVAVDTSGAAGSSLHAITEHANTTGFTAHDTVSGALAFTDADLTDAHTVSMDAPSFGWSDSSGHPLVLTAAQQNALTQASTLALELHDSTGTGFGSIDFAYSAADSNFDFLAADQKLTITYHVTITDNHNVTSTKPVTITIIGTNDTPIIVGETDAPTQAVIVLSPVQPIVLGEGVNTNSLGLATETFDSQPHGSFPANYGDFYSAVLHATFSGSGNAGVVNGSLDGSVDITAPFMGPLPGETDTTNFLAIAAGGTETITFATEHNALGLYWGSVDAYNTIAFYHGTTLIASYTGADLSPLFADGNRTSFSSNGYVEFSGLALFDKVVFTSTSDAFEVENISAGNVPAPHVELAAPITGTLSVSDADIGDTLTASVIGNAVIKYNGHNGSTTLPGNADVDALKAASAVTFDTVQTNGGVNVLHWTYDPDNPDLDFLKSGDTLTITFMAQVNDGHGSVGEQALTITIAGTDTSHISGFAVVNGTSGNDTFNNVGNNATIFGADGHDTFVFKPGFAAATIGDFDVNNDAINIDHSLFATVSAFVAAAQSANSGHDTIITDPIHHNTITLTGVTVAQLNAHPSDFHII
jgi:VCBS repeat-containing protein